MDIKMLEMLQGMSPEEIEQFTQNFGGQRGSLQDQQSQAQQLRQSSQDPQGTNAGGQYMAANPMARLAEVGNKFIGAHQGKQAREGLEELSGKEASLQQMLMSHILKGGQQQPQLDPNSLQDAPLQPYNPNQQMS